MQMDILTVWGDVWMDLYRQKVTSIVLGPNTDAIKTLSFLAEKMLSCIAGHEVKVHMTNANETWLFSKAIQKALATPAPDRYNVFFSMLIKDRIIRASDIADIF